MFLITNVSNVNTKGCLRSQTRLYSSSCSSCSCSLNRKIGFNNLWNICKTKPGKLISGDEGGGGPNKKGEGGGGRSDKKSLN